MNADAIYGHMIMVKGIPTRADKGIYHRAMMEYIYANNVVPLFFNKTKRPGVVFQGTPSKLSSVFNGFFPGKT